MKIGTNVAKTNTAWKNVNATAVTKFESKIWDSKKNFVSKKRWIKKSKVQTDHGQKKLVKKIQV